MRKIKDTVEGKCRKVIVFLPFCLLAFLLLTASCSESDNTVEEFANWKNTNLSYWDKLYAETQTKVNGGDASWKIFKSYSIADSSKSPDTDFIIANVQTAGSGSGCPLFSDSVRVRYSGRLLPSKSYTDGYVFDTINNDGVADFKVSTRTTGFATALQHMHIGDVWEVYVPWTLGYGESGANSIPGWSVLRFRIQLLAYARAGESLPKFK